MLTMDSGNPVARAWDGRMRGNRISVMPGETTHSEIVRKAAGLLDHCGKPADYAAMESSVERILLLTLPTSAHACKQGNESLRIGGGIKKPSRPEG